MEFKNLSLVLKKIVDEYKAPSVDCIVYKDHKLLYREFYGKTDIENTILESSNSFLNRLAVNFVA